MGERLQRALPGVGIYFSSEVPPKLREFERNSPGVSVQRQTCRRRERWIRTPGSACHLRGPEAIIVGFGCLPSNGRGCHAVFSPPTRFASSCMHYNLGNFMRTLAMPKTAQAWSLSEPAREADQDRRQGGEPRLLRYFPDAKVVVSARMFQEILPLIARLRAPPAPA